MSGATWRFAGWRFRTTLRRRWGGYLSVILLIGLVAGVGLGAIAGARRTQSSFPAYIASSNPTTFENISTGIVNPQLGPLSGGYVTTIVHKLEHLPHVAHLVTTQGLDVLPLEAHGYRPLSFPGAPPQAGEGLGSDGGEWYTQDRLTVVQGRLADPRRADEVDVQSLVAQQYHWHLGQRFRMGVYTNAQTQLPGFGTAVVKPFRITTVTVVGLVVNPRNLVEDDVDLNTYVALFTPAFTLPIRSCCSNYSESGVQVVGGSRYDRQVEDEIAKFEPGFPPPATLTTVVAKAERAIKPESIALGIFGGLALLASLVIAAQVLSRQVRMARPEQATERALGAPTSMLAADVLVGLLGSVVLGALAAVGVAVALSPLMPLGPVRPVDPTPGVSVDTAVLGWGLLGLVALLGGLTVALTMRALPRRATRQRAARRARAVSVTGPATWGGLPPSASTGIRFALDPGTGTNSVPVRSAMVGAMLAVAVLVTTVIFGSSLNTLVSHPRLYGWNWDALLAAGGAGGGGDAPAGPTARLLDHDRYVRAWSGAYTADLYLDGVEVPVFGEQPRAAVQPPVLSGHGLEGAGQVVLGPATLAQLHQHLGGTLEVSQTAGGRATRLTIVGTATMPTLGGGSGPHLEMGEGALVRTSLVPEIDRNPFGDPLPGPGLILVDYRAGAPQPAAAHSLDVIARKLSNTANFGVARTPVQHPAEIVNYRSMGTTPAILGGALCLGAVAALALTLLASVRRRRRDLALLKALGFTHRQVAGAVAWQSNITVVIGIALGLPLGVIAGRLLWTAFAHEINAVPSPAVPVVTIVLVGVGALLLANVVAAVPSFIAARTSTTRYLRAE